MTMQRWRIKESAYEKFMSFVMPVTETGCWLWIGGASLKLGYGRFYYHGQTFEAHRWSYEYYKGPIPEGNVIDHKCRVTSCVNPAHLRAVTPKQNTIENSVGPSAKNAVKTHCISGHEFTPENTYRHGNKRYCRICLVANRRRFIEKAARQALAAGEEK